METVALQLAKQVIRLTGQLLDVDDGLVDLGEFDPYKLV